MNEIWLTTEVPGAAAETNVAAVARAAAKVVKDFIAFFFGGGRVRRRERKGSECMER